MKTLFILATHGDEGFSIPVFEKLVSQYPKEKFNYDWVIGNPKALAKKTRFVDVDLNRNAPGSPNSDKYEEQRAAELIALAKNFDVVVDIHGAKSNCGICTIVSLPILNNLLLATQFNCQNNIIWNSGLSKEKGPINQHIGKPSIELECGPKDEKNIQDELYSVISEYLDHQGIVQFMERKNWFTVAQKLNKTDFVNFEKWDDFGRYTVNETTIVPFLSKNTYADGSFYQLQEIEFGKLFER